MGHLFDKSYKKKVKKRGDSFHLKRELTKTIQWRKERRKEGRKKGGRERVRGKEDNVLGKRQAG